MAMLKSYTCSKCAGVLNFDSDQEFFECPFCGTAFDVLDFHGDEVMEQARSLLKNESFDAAREKYKAILKYDPKTLKRIWELFFVILRSLLQTGWNSPISFLNMMLLMSENRS